MEGVNPTKPTDNILTSSDLRKVDRTGFILLPYVNNATITSIDIDSNGGEINDNIVVTSSDNSNKAVQYLSVDVSQTTNDSSVTVTFNPSGDTVNYVIEEYKGKGELDVNLNIAFGANVFFSTLMKDLLSCTQSFIESQMEHNDKVSQILAENGIGINHTMDSLKEISQNLMKWVG